MNITEIHDTLKALNLFESQYQFSADWLGKSRTYYSAIRSAKREPSIEALTTLLVRINSLRRRLDEEIPSPSCSHHPGEAREILGQVVIALENAVEWRCLGQEVGAGTVETNRTCQEGDPNPKAARLQQSGLERRTEAESR